MSHKLLALAGASCLLLTGCIDDNYDLSDIDTTSEVKVDNLTLPINIDKMKLDNVFSLEDNSNIKIVDVNGERFYALTQTGEFKSQPIEIQSIHIAKPGITPTHTDLVLPWNSQSKRRRAQGDIPDIENIPILSSNTPFKYAASGLDPAIYGMNAIYTTNTTLTISATIQGADIKFVELKDLYFQLPTGLEVTDLPRNASYNHVNGVLYMPSLKSANGHDVSLSLTIDKMDLTSVNPKLTFDKDKGSMDIDGTLGLKEGSLLLNTKEILQNGIQLPQSLSIDIKYDLSAIDVIGLSGNIDYTLEGIDIAPVSIGDLPDFLKGEGTNIKVANPQLYLSLNNPIGDQKLYYETGFKLTALRDNGMAPQVFEPDNNAKIRVLYNKGVTGPYNFLLAPNPKSAQVPEGFANPTPVGFSSLSNILSVPEADAAQATLPERIKIEVVKPGIPDQHTDYFPLGRQLTPVEGKYELIAPFGFKEGTVVIYEDTEDGWSDDDLKHLTVTEMTITATVDNDAPVSAQLESYAINTTGAKIGDLASNVIEASKKDQSLTITLKGEIKDLDGIHIRAIMRSGDDQKPLAPDQTLTFKNVRVTVSGNYTKDF